MEAVVSNADSHLDKWVVKSSKKRKRHHADNEDVVPHPLPSDKKSKKSKRDKGVVMDEAIVVASESSEDRSGNSTGKKKIKAKKSKGLGLDVQPVDNNAPQQEREIVASEEPKKRKNKTGLPDPQDEAGLTEQAQKALEYAFTRFRKPSKWKFNKARQNWLIRNLWDSQLIPDNQYPLVIKYLADVQGGTREALLKTCGEILAPKGELGSETTEPSVVDPKRVRAEKLLETLETSKS